MEYYIEKQDIHLITPYNTEFIAEVKEIIGRKYDMDTKHWFIPITAQNINPIEKILEKYKFNKRSDTDVLPQFDINPNKQNEVSYKRSLDILKHKIELLGLKLQPRNYQLSNIDYLIKSKRCIDGSEMGVGKTFTSIFSVESENLFPCLVVTPASIKYNWKIQWSKINPKRKISVIDDDQANFSADVVIINYDKLGKKTEDDKVELKFDNLSIVEWKSVICDESQYLKNPKAVRSKSVKMICKKVEYVFFLSGTTIMNRPSELISPLSILGKFNMLFGNWRNFVYRYCDATQSRYGLDISGATNVTELNNILKTNSYVRIEKRDVLKELPEIEETIYEVELDNEKEYRKAENDLIGYLKNTYGKEKAEKAENAEHLVLINTLRQLSVKGKLTSIVELINLYLESCDRKLLIFGVYKESLKALSEIYKCKIITGEVSSKERQKIIDNFQNNKSRVLIGNIQSLGVGVDGLQNVCSDMIFIELPYRFTDISQAVSRLERDGQKNSISVQYVLAKNTIDELIWEVLSEKRKVTDGVNRGIEVTETENIMKNILRKYREI